VSERNPPKGTVAALLKAAMVVRRPTLSDTPVSPDAKVTSGRETRKLKDLRLGQVVSLELAANPGTGLVIVGIKVMDKPEGPQSNQARYNREFLAQLAAKSGTGPHVKDLPSLRVVLEAVDARARVITAPVASEREILG